MENGSQVTFGLFRLDVPGGCLWREGQVQKLTLKAFAVLCCLVERVGQVVTKEQVFRVVWPDTVVSEAALTVCIRELRQALGDDAKSPRYIEMVHRRGYRFIGEVASSQQSVVSIRELSGVRDPASEVKNSYSAFSNPQSAINLVGREAELAQLHSWLAKTLSGERQIVFVTGEAGIGKTALI